MTQKVTQSLILVQATVAANKSAPIHFQALWIRMMILLLIGIINELLHNIVGMYRNSRKLQKKKNSEAEWLSKIKYPNIVN